MTDPVHRVVLIGYMCSGKSTVGAALARRLEWSFVDLDAEIEHLTGGSVKALVQAQGERALRALEDELTGRLAGCREVVLAPGGGWITVPDRLAALGPGTLAVWLQASPETIVRRVDQDPRERPFRDHPDPLEAVGRMLDARDPFYRLADFSVVTDRRSAEAVAIEIEAVVRRVGGARS